MERLDLGELSPRDVELTLPDRLTLASKLRGRLKLERPARPDIYGGPGADIDADNLRALSVIYAAAQLEAIKLFVVADKITEHFVSGLLSISGSPAADPVYAYLKAAGDRLTEAERRDLYARSFGPPLGPASEPNANAAFSDLWYRFVAEASGFPCDGGPDEKRAAGRRTFESARNLAKNLSPRGAGVAHFAAVELQSTIKTILKIFSYPEILQAYGVLDYTMLMERVSVLYLGGPIFTIRGRVLAWSGAAIINWLAERAASLAPPGRSLDLCGNLELLEHVRRWLACDGLDSGPNPGI